MARQCLKLYKIDEKIVVEMRKIVEITLKLHENSVKATKKMKIIEKTAQNIVKMI